MACHAGVRPARVPLASLAPPTRRSRVGAGPPVIILVGLYFMPESPRWLVAKGHDAQAAAVLARAAGPNEALATLHELRQLAALPKRGIRELCASTGATRRLLIAGIGVAFCQQATGIEAQVYYTPEILNSAGMGGDPGSSKALQGQMLVGAVKFLTILLATALVDRPGRWFGRRTLLIVSAVGMIAGQLLLGINYSVWSSPGVALFAQCFFMAAFSIGYGPVTWILTSEIFPLAFRGSAMGVATFVNRLTSGVIAASFLSLRDAIGDAGPAFLYAGVGGFVLLFTMLLVPETKVLPAHFAPHRGRA